MRAAVHVRLRGERYVLDVADAREVEERGELTPVPGAPAAVAGVRNLRGAVLPVVELADALGLGAGPAGPYVVVAVADGLTAGLAVDEVLGVEPLPYGWQRVQERGVRARTVIDGEGVALLDVAAILREVAEAA